MMSFHKIYIKKKSRAGNRIENGWNRDILEHVVGKEILSEVTCDQRGRENTSDEGAADRNEFERLARRIL